MASVNVTSEANKRLARAFMSVFGRFVLGTPSDPSDFLTTLEADLGHDTTGRLHEISVPTLIIGGSEDPFFSESAPARNRRENLRRGAAGVRGSERGPERAQAPVRGRRARVPQRRSLSI